jgi:hypothetical protein
MSWHLQKRWLPRKKMTGLEPIKPGSSTEPVQRIKPIRLTQPTKPMAPIGFHYYWTDD